MSCFIGGPSCITPHRLCARAQAPSARATFQKEMDTGHDDFISITELDTFPEDMNPLDRVRSIINCW